MFCRVCRRRDVPLLGSRCASCRRSALTHSSFPRWARVCPSVPGGWKCSVEGCVHCHSYEEEAASRADYMRWLRLDRDFENDAWENDEWENDEWENNELENNAWDNDACYEWTDGGGWTYDDWVDGAIVDRPTTRPRPIGEHFKPAVPPVVTTTAYPDFRFAYSMRPML